MMKVLTTASLGSNFTGSYKKRVYCNLHYYKRLVPKVHEYFSVMVSGNDCKYYNLIES